MGVEKVLDYIGVSRRLQKQELTLGWMLPSAVGHAWAEHPCSRYERGLSDRACLLVRLSCVPSAKRQTQPARTFIYLQPASQLEFAKNVGDR
eukprot:3407844-Pyramimonas_sp.AAC.1